MSGDRTAFFYGTLMSPAILYRVVYGNPNPDSAVKALLTIRPALLPGFRRHRVEGADFPAILPLSHADANGGDNETAAGGTAEADPKTSVRGTFVTGLTPANIARLDGFEGNWYERRFVDVQLVSGKEKGEWVKAETYVWVLSHDMLETEEWDFDEFMREKASFWIGADREDFDDADDVNDDYEVPTAKAIQEQVESGDCGTQQEPLKSAV